MQKIQTASRILVNFRFSKFLFTVFNVNSFSLLSSLDYLGGFTKKNLFYCVNRLLLFYVFIPSNSIFHHFPMSHFVFI